jgi:muramidase (phage lysozyme)
LQDRQEGAASGSFRRMHNEAYKDRGFEGPFERTANFTVGAISSSAASIAFYFGASHALSLWFAHLEQRGTENLVYDIYEKASVNRPGALRSPLPILSDSVDSLVRVAAGAYGSDSKPNLAIRQTLDALVDVSIRNEEELTALIDSETDTKRQGLLQKFRDERRPTSTTAARPSYLTLIDDHISPAVSALGETADLETRRKAANLSIGYDSLDKKEWNVTKLTQRGLGRSMTDALSLFRKGEGALIEAVVIPLLEKFMKGSDKQKLGLIGELRDLVNSDLSLNLKDEGHLVSNLGIERKQRMANLWDKMTELMPANFASALEEHSEAAAAPDSTNVMTRTANGGERVVRGSSISVKALIGTGFVDIIRLTAAVGRIGGGLFSGETLDFRTSLKAVRSNFALTQEKERILSDLSKKTTVDNQVLTDDIKKLLDRPKANAFALAPAKTTLGIFASTRRSLFMVGSVLIIDKVFDQFYAKSQGIDLYTQLAAEVSGSMGKDEKRFGRNEFTGTMPGYVKNIAIGTGGFIGGHLINSTYTIDLEKRLAGKFGADSFLPSEIEELKALKEADKAARLPKTAQGTRFRGTYALIGSLGFLLGAQAIHSTAAGYLNFLYNRGKNNGLDVSPEGAALASLFGETVRREREAEGNDPVSAAKYAHQQVLLEAAKDFTQPNIDNTKVTYSNAIQLPNPVFQLTFVSRRDPASGITSYGGGFQLMPILGAGAIPTAPFGIRTGKKTDRPKSIEARIEYLMAKNRDNTGLNKPSESGLYRNPFAVQKSERISDFTNIIQYIPESQMMGALATIGALSYAGSLFTSFDDSMTKAAGGVASAADADALRSLRTVVGYGLSQTERLLRLSQVPTLLIPDLTKTFLGKISAKPIDFSKGRLASVGRNLRTLGPILLLSAAFLNLTSSDSSFGGASAVSMLGIEHELTKDPTTNYVKEIDQATSQRLYSAAVASTYYSLAFSRAGVFNTARSFTNFGNPQGYGDKVNQNEFRGVERYRAHMARVYHDRLAVAQKSAKLNGTLASFDSDAFQPQLIHTAGLRTGLAARKLFKYSAIAYGASYLASALNLLDHDGPLSFVLDPLRLAGFDNLDEEERRLLRFGGKEQGAQAEASFSGFAGAMSNFVVNGLMGIFNAGKLTGSYQDNPGMFANIGGPFGFSESKYGAKPYIQATSTFMDISNSQVDMKRMFGASKDAEMFMRAVMKQQQGATSASLYYALTGSTPRKTPMALKGNVTSSEMQALSGSSGLSRALAVRQAELNRISNQRPQELYYAQLFQREAAVRLAQKRGDKAVFFPGSDLHFDINTISIGWKDQTLLTRFLSIFTEETLNDPDALDNHLSKTATQGEVSLPFIGTYYRSFAESASLRNEGSSKLGLIDVGIGVGLTVMAGAAIYSLLSTGIAAYGLSSINSEISSLKATAQDLFGSYGFAYSASARSAPGSFELSPRGTSLYLSRRFRESSPAPSSEMIEVYKRGKTNLVNYASSLADKDADAILEKIVEQYRFSAAAYNMEPKDIEKDIRTFYESKPSFRTAINTTDNQGLSQLRQAKKEKQYAEFLKALDDNLISQQFEEVATDVDTGYYRSPTPLSRYSSRSTVRLRQAIDTVGYTGLAKASVVGIGQGIFHIASASDLYSLGSSLTETASTSASRRKQAAYYSAAMIAETGFGFAAKPLVKLATSNLLASGLILGVSILGVNLDRMAGGHILKGIQQGLTYAEKNFYQPLLRGAGTAIEAVTSVGIVGAVLSALGIPFRTLDPFFNGLLMQSQNNVATGFLGQFLLPRPLESFLDTQQGLFPDPRSYLGYRPEAYTKREIDADRARRYQSNIRRALSSYTSLSPELIYTQSQLTPGALQYSRYASSAGYAERVLSNLNQSMGTSNVLRMALLRRQADVNHTILIGYRGPDNAVKDMFDFVYQGQLLKAGFFKYGSYSGFLNASIETVSLMLTKAIEVINGFDPTVVGSPANRATSWADNKTKRGVAKTKRGVAKLGNLLRLPSGVGATLPRGGGNIIKRIFQSEGASRIASEVDIRMPGVFLSFVTGSLAWVGASVIADRLGVKDEERGNIAWAASTTVSLGTLGLTPQILKIAYGSSDQLDAALKLGKLSVSAGGVYKLAAGAVKISPFIAVGLLVSVLAPTTKGLLNRFGKDLSEKDYQTTANVGAMAGTLGMSYWYFYARSRAYKAAADLNRRSGSDGTARARTYGVVGRDIRQGSQRLLSSFNNLRPRGKGITGLVALTIAGFALGFNPADALTSIGELGKGIIESPSTSLNTTLALSVGGALFVGFNFYKQDKAAFMDEAQKQRDKLMNASKPFQANTLYKSKLFLRGFWEVTAGVTKGFSGFVDNFNRGLHKYLIDPTSKALKFAYGKIRTLPLGRISVLATPTLTTLLTGKEILDIRPNSTRAKSNETYSNFFRGAAGSALMIFTRGRIRSQFASMALLDTALTDNDFIDGWADDRYDEAQALTTEELQRRNTRLLVGTTAAVGGTTALAVAARRGAFKGRNPVGLRALGRLVNTAVGLYAISEGNKKRTEALKGTVVTHSTFTEQVVDTLSTDISNAAFSAGGVAWATNGPWGPILSLGLFATGYATQSNAFKNFLLSNYGERITRAGINTQPKMRALRREVAETAQRGAVIGGTTAGVGVGAYLLGTAIAIGVGAGSLAAGAAAIASAPVWLPALAIAAGIVLGSYLIGAAVGGWAGIESHLRKKETSQTTSPTKPSVKKSGGFNISWLESLFGGAAKAQTQAQLNKERQVIEATRARNKGLLTTFWRPKKEPEFLPVADTDVDASGRKKKPWWERAWDWVTQTASSALSGAKRLLRRAQGAAEVALGPDSEFGYEGLTDNQRGWLNAIKFAEGTLRPGMDSYRVMFGGKLAKDLSRHPDLVNRSPGYASTAAGAYQFLTPTWAAAAKALGLKDFSPASQDKAALWLLKNRGINTLTDPMTRENMAKVAPEWASFPTLSGRSYWNQPVKSPESIQAAFIAGKSGKGGLFGLEGGTFDKGVGLFSSARNLSLLSISGQAGDRLLTSKSNFKDTGLHDGHEDVRRGLYVRDYVIFNSKDPRLSKNTQDYGKPVALPSGYNLIPRVSGGGRGGEIVEWTDPKTGKVIAKYIHISGLTREVKEAAKNRTVVRGGTVFAVQDGRPDIDPYGSTTPHVHLEATKSFHEAFIDTYTLPSSSRRPNDRPQVVTSSGGRGGNQGTLRPPSSTIPQPTSTTSTTSYVDRTPKATQRDWSVETTRKPTRLMIAAGHADAPDTGAKGEIPFMGALLNRLEYHIRKEGLGDRVGFYRPGGATTEEDPRSQYSIALRSAQRGDYYLELHSDADDGTGKTGIIVANRDKRFGGKQGTPAHALNPFDAALANRYGSFSKNHRVDKDGALGVPARGGRILEVTAMNDRIRGIISSGDRRKINALLDSFILGQGNLLQIIKENFKKPGTSTSGRQAQAPSNNMAPKTARSMTESSLNVVAAIPAHEQSALMVGAQAVVAAMQEEVARGEKQIATKPVVVNPDKQNKTPDSVDAISDPFNPRVPLPRAPIAVDVKIEDGMRTVEVATAIPVVVHQTFIANGSIPLNTVLMTDHEPTPLGDHGGNAVTPYGIMQSMGSFG